jgi:hypothetical protein
VLGSVGERPWLIGVVAPADQPLVPGRGELVVAEEDGRAGTQAGVPPVEKLGAPLHWYV